MNMTLEDSRLLVDLCEQHDVSADKVLKLTSFRPRVGSGAGIRR